MENYKLVDNPIAKGEKISSQCDFERVDEGSNRSLIGCLLYLIASRLDIMFVISLLSRYMHYCYVVQLNSTKRVLKYVKGTLSYEVKYVKKNELRLIGFSNNDWVGFVEDIKSTSRCFFTLGSSVFSWSSRKQETVAQSIVEAEYIVVATSTVVSQALWLRKLMPDLNLMQVEATEIYCHN